MTKPPTISTAPQRMGRIAGALEAGEDRSLLEELLRQAPSLIAAGTLELKTHEHALSEGRSAMTPERLATRVDAIRQGRLARYVVQVETAAGPRIVKFAEPTTLGRKLLGLAGSSVARIEHRNQRRAEQLDLAASRTRGYLELRSGPCLVRACQVQTLVPEDLQPLTTFLAHEERRFGDAAIERFAEALAASHAKRFFHADLKGFHAFAADVRDPGTEPACYRLLWLDLGRVGFRLSRRRRIINLYQALRFVVPRRDETEERFVIAYCRASGWSLGREAAALRAVRRFLAYKLRTHPHA